MKHKRLLITLTLGLGSLVGSWWVCVGMARPVSSQHPPALEDPCFSPATARQPIGAASAGGVLSDSAFLSTAILGPIKDNTLYERYEDSSSGAGAYLKAGIKCPDTRRRGVIAFDVAGGVPAGSTIVNATLRLSMTRRSCQYTPHRSISLHRLLADWGEGTSIAGDDCLGGAATEGDATWAHRFYSHTLWTTPGADFDATASATTVVVDPGFFYEWGSTAETVADVQAWLDNPATNFGWLVRGEEDVCFDPDIYTNTLTIFATKEHPAEADRPVLIIQFEPPPLPALVASKRVNDPTPHVGERITYTIVASNNGLGDATDVLVSDALPAELNFVGPVTLDPPGAGTPGAPPILGSGLFITAGRSVTLTFPVTVAKGQAVGTQLINTVAVSSAEVPTPTTGAVAISISSAITVNKTVNNANPVGNETITYTIAVANNGSIDATGVLVSDTLPAGINFVGPVTLDPPGAGTVGAPPILGSGLFIRAGYSITLTFPVTVAKGLAIGTRLTNTVAVTSAEEPSPATGAVVIQYLPPPVLAVSKGVNNATPHVGERITYTIVASNNGLGDATDVLVSDALPAELNFVGPVTLDPPGAGTPGAPPILGSGLFITAGRSVTLTFPVTVAKGQAVGTQLINTVAVSSAEVPTPTTGAVAISISSAITVDKTVDNASPAGHETITYTIAVANNGSIDATGVLVSDTLPAGINFVGPVTLDPPGAGTVGAPPILGSGLFIRAGYSITLTFPVKIGKGLAVGTRLTNTVAVTSAEEPSPATGTVVIRYLPPPSTAHLSSIQDNTLYEHPAGDLSNGAGQHFFVGMNDMVEKRRGVIAFDVVGSIPAGSTVVSATLRLNMSKTSSGPQPSALHRLLADWGEGTSDTLGAEGEGTKATLGDATWLHTFYDIGLWTMPGGDFAATASATTDVADVGFYEWGSTAGMVADVRAWLDNPATNSGWLLLGNESAKHTTKRFDTREHPTEANRPVLIIQFVPPPGLTVSKGVNDPIPHVGERITYTIVVSNSGSVDATDALVSDALPAELGFVGPVVLDPPGAGIVGAPPVLCSGLFIAAGHSITLTFPVTVARGLAVGTRLTNTVAVTSAEVSVPATGAVAISISNAIAVNKAVDNANPVGNETITYTIAIANNGSIDATGILVSDTMPAGLNFVGPVTLDPPGAGTLGAPPILGSGLFITAGHSITLTFPVRVGEELAVGTKLINTVAVTSAQASTQVIATVTITVDSASKQAYLPIILKNP